MSALQALFEQWREFAFGLPDERAARRLQRTKLVVRTGSGIASSGRAKEIGRGFEIVVTVGYSGASARETLLHEMAHVVAGWRDGSYHTKRWRRTFAQAVRVVTGQQIDEHCVRHENLDKQARQAMCRSRQQA